MKYGRQPDGTYLRNPNSVGRPFTKGHPVSEEIKSVLRKKALLRGVPNEEMRRRSLLSRGVKRSLESRRRIGLAKIGEKNPQYGKKGHLSPTWTGTTELRKAIRQLIKTRDWKMNVFRRDFFTCQKCSYRGRNLHCHHVIPFDNIFKEFINKYNQFSPMEDKETLTRLSESYEPFWEVSNGLTLCGECHMVGVHHVG